MKRFVNNLWLDKFMTVFKPHLEILPHAQRVLWEELHSTPEHFTLYGGTALALYLGHRKSIDFDFFTRQPIEARDLINSVPYLADAQQRAVAKNTLTCLVDRGGEVKLQFFGGLPLGVIEPRQQASGSGVWVASLLDVAASKIKVLPERSEAKDYLDVAAILKSGIDIHTMLSAASAVYGRAFNPVVAVKAMTYFSDVGRLEESVKAELIEAAKSFDFNKMKTIKPLQSFAGQKVSP